MSSGRLFGEGWPLWRTKKKKEIPLEMKRRSRTRGASQDGDLPRGPSFSVSTSAAVGGKKSKVSSRRPSVQTSLPTHDVGSGSGLAAGNSNSNSNSSSGKFSPAQRRLHHRSLAWCLASCSRTLQRLKQGRGSGSIAINNKKTKKSGAYRLLYMTASAVAFSNALTYGALGPFFPLYAETRFGCSPTQIGMIMSAYPVVNIATSPCCGYLMRRFGNWNLLFVGLVLLTAGTAMYGLTSSVTGLYLASGMHGASLSFVHVSSLALLSAFPDNLTDAMGGIEIWSGLALVVGPPLGGFVHSFWGVEGVFVIMSLFPFSLCFLGPYVRAKLALSNEFSVDEEEVAGVSLRTVMRSRGVVGGAVITAYNYMLIGFLEVSLSPHLERSLATSPGNIGLLFILPNLMYSIMAAKAGTVVESLGVKRTMLWGFLVLSISLFFLGPYPPFLVPPGVYESTTALRVLISLGLVMFQIGSALAAVPSFTAMQNSASFLGRGADYSVASLHSISIGLGEALGPMLGGAVLDSLPRVRVPSCAMTHAKSFAAAAAAAAEQAAQAAQGAGKAAVAAAAAGSTAVGLAKEAGDAVESIGRGGAEQGGGGGGGGGGGEGVGAALQTGAAAIGTVGSAAAATLVQGVESAAAAAAALGLLTTGALGTTREENGMIDDDFMADDSGGGGGGGGGLFGGGQGPTSAGLHGLGVGGMAGLGGLGPGFGGGGGEYDDMTEDEGGAAVTQEMVVAKCMSSFPLACALMALLSLPGLLLVGWVMPDSIGTGGGAGGGRDDVDGVPGEANDDEESSLIVGRRKSNV